MCAGSPDCAKRVGIEWLGATHPAVCCLEIGVAVHHAGLPKAFLREIEHLLRARKLSVIISSPTLAQGLNLSASVLLMYSIRRGSKLISGEEFGNVIGRAGRARVDIDGQILYVLYAPSRWRLHEWEKLIAAARERRIQSGLFTLIGLVQEEAHDSECRGVPVPIPAPSAATWRRAHPQLRISRQPATRHPPATLLPTAPRLREQNCFTGIAAHPPASVAMELSSLRWNHARR